MGRRQRSLQKEELSVHPLCPPCLRLVPECESELQVGDWGLLGNTRGFDLTSKAHNAAIVPVSEADLLHVQTELCSILTVSVCLLSGDRKDSLERLHY